MEERENKFYRYFEITLRGGETLDVFVDENIDLTNMFYEAVWSKTPNAVWSLDTTKSLMGGYSEIQQLIIRVDDVQAVKESIQKDGSPILYSI